ncbi:hypothetical protein IVA96_22285 [Bradyrhizobium sp. 159]|uniref:hypothetical protein n=1 Tax=Bradyrhizobium sp. 159 TaxID=2782632 RepID=UPI001FF94C2A|nr:hypothetical protein [Bradyrhizobium sp. 159]MCK1619250.1 hypothetical protein [Bradyrhizobium sp. 159]
MIKASGRAALILVAGLFLVFGGVAQAAPNSAESSKSDSAGNQADAAKPSKQRHHESRRASSKTAQKTDKKDAAANTSEAKAGIDGTASSQMPPEVANAHAQLTATDMPTAAAATAMTGRANDNVQAAAADDTANNTAAETQVVAPDQLNDIDRAVQQDNPPAQKAVVAATEAQPRPTPVMASSQQSSAWDQSSLIGKIFIGVGTFLTLASAARMFMA